MFDFFNNFHEKNFKQKTWWCTSASRDCAGKVSFNSDVWTKSYNGKHVRNFNRRFLKTWKVALTWFSFSTLQLWVSMYSQARVACQAYAPPFPSTYMTSGSSPNRVCICLTWVTSHNQNRTAALSMTGRYIDSMIGFWRPRCGDRELS